MVSGNRLPNGPRGFDSLNPHHWLEKDGLEPNNLEQDNVEGVAQTDKRTGKRIEPANRTGMRRAKSRRGLRMHWLAALGDEPRVGV
jgi:hypothetical protein